MSQLHRNHDKLNHVFIEAPLAENPPTDPKADILGYKYTKKGKKFERIEDVQILKEDDCIKVLKGIYEFRKDQICAERKSNSIITGTVSIHTKLKLIYINNLNPASNLFKLFSGRCSRSR